MIQIEAAAERLAAFFVFVPVALAVWMDVRLARR
jgi:hypothetical protein